MDEKAYEKKIEELEIELEKIQKFTGFFRTPYPNYPYKRKHPSGYWVLYTDQKPLWGQSPVPEQRYLMEQKLGHKIPAGMIVHHKDGNKMNNSLENLELMDRKTHARVHRNRTDCLKNEQKT